MTQQSHHLSLPTMTCSGCEASIRGALSNLPGVDSIRINLGDRTIIVSGNIQIDPVIAAIAMAGYRATKLSLTTE